MRTLIGASEVSLKTLDTGAGTESTSARPFRSYGRLLPSTLENTGSITRWHCRGRDGQDYGSPVLMDILYLRQRGPA